MTLSGGSALVVERWLGVGSAMVVEVWDKLAERRERSAAWPPTHVPRHSRAPTTDTRPAAFPPTWTCQAAGT